MNFFKNLFINSNPKEKNTEPSLPKQKDIETSLLVQKSTFTDSRDGKTYKTVKIGNQEWMAENLAYLPTVGPSPKDPYARKYYVYGYEGTNVAKAKKLPNYLAYGVLYSWYDANAVCPPGWHLPTDAEWTELEDYLRANGFDYDGIAFLNNISKSLAATTGWRSSSDIGAIGNNLSLNNKSGFSALPGGYLRINGTFSSIGSRGYWWCATQTQLGYAIQRYLSYDGSYVYRSVSDTFCSFSVRCVRDK